MCKLGLRANPHQVNAWKGGIKKVDLDGLYDLEAKKTGSEPDRPYARAWRVHNLKEKAYFRISVVLVVLVVQEQE